MRTLKSSAIGLIAAGLAIASLGAPAGAEVRNYAKNGVWTNFAGINEKSDYMCGMSVMDRYATQSVMVKYAPADGGVMYIHLFKQGWRIPQGTKVAVSLDFDADHFGEVNEAYGAMSKSGAGMVELYLSGADEIKHFFNQVAEANTMTVTFPNGNEAPWKVSMDGSRKTVELMISCMARAEANRPSQPFGQGQSSQPFGQSQQQPFAPTPAPAMRKPQPGERGA